MISTSLMLMVSSAVMVADYYVDKGSNRKGKESEITISSQYEKVKKKLFYNCVFILNLFSYREG